MSNEEVEKLYKENKINEYFYDQLRRNWEFLSEDLRDDYLIEAQRMSAIGVDSPEKQKVFFYIWLHLSEILDDILKDPREAKSLEILSRVSSVVFDNVDKHPIDNLHNFIAAVAIAADFVGLNVKDEILDKVNVDVKKAYPQGYGSHNIKPSYDIDKWVNATDEIYSGIKMGFNYGDMFEHVTRNWNKMEKLDFNNWLSFYQENAHEKYKTAQHQSSSRPFFPKAPKLNPLKSDLPQPPNENSKKNKEPDFDKSEVRDKVETQRSKIISRLNAAEKLLSSLDGQLFAGDDQELMLQLLQDLKRKVQTTNKLRLRSSIFEDFIYRAGNYLNKYGKTTKANFFYKIAQDKEPNLEEAAEELLDPPKEEREFEDKEKEPSEIEVDELSEVPLSQSYDEVDSVTQDTINAIQEFYSLLDSGVSSVDNSLLDDDVISVEAQAQLQRQPQQNKPQVGERGQGTVEKLREKSRTGHFEIDDIIEQALKNITVEDVVARLEMLSSIFKKREIARQLAIIDMMMDRLGIGTFFPSLGEATRSALDSNQYVSTRIEEVLSKLRGALEQRVSPEELLSGDMEDKGEEVTGLKEKLKTQDQKEQERKELRQQKRQEKEDQELMGRDKTDVVEELKQPAKVEQETPANIPR